MSSELDKPDSHTLNELKKHLKAESRPQILGCLVRLKEDTQCCRRLARAGGLDLLVQLLRYQDAKIINAALSLLANVCMNSDIRQQVSLSPNPSASVCPSTSASVVPCVAAYSIVRLCHRFSCMRFFVYFVVFVAGANELNEIACVVSIAECRNYETFSFMSDKQKIDNISS